MNNLEQSLSLDPAGYLLYTKPPTDILRIYTAQITPRHSPPRRHQDLSYGTGRKLMPQLTTSSPWLIAVHIGQLSTAMSRAFPLQPSPALGYRIARLSNSTGCVVDGLVGRGTDIRIFGCLVERPQATRRRRFVWIGCGRSTASFGVTSRDGV